MKRTLILPLVSVVFILLTILPGESLAWFNDPKVNSVIAPKPTNQLDQTAISDGRGGAIFTWSEQVDGSDTDFDIYAQRLDAHGNPVWPAPVAKMENPGWPG